MSFERCGHPCVPCGDVAESTADHVPGQVYIALLTSALRLVHVVETTTNFIAPDLQDAIDAVNRWTSSAYAASLSASAPDEAAQIRALTATLRNIANYTRENPSGFVHQIAIAAVPPTGQT